jgi:hypothetical protein
VIIAVIIIAFLLGRAYKKKPAEALLPAKPPRTFEAVETRVEAPQTSINR